jgi:hypothetical protein
LIGSGVSCVCLNFFWKGNLSLECKRHWLMAMLNDWTLNCNPDGSGCIEHVLWKEIHLQWHKWIATAEVHMRGRSLLPSPKRQTWERVSHGAEGSTRWGAGAERDQTPNWLAVTMNHCLAEMCFRQSLVHRYLVLFLP